MKRLMRRAILRSMAIVGIEVLDLGRDAHVEAGRVERVIGATPLTPATRLCQKVGWSLPMGVTAPRPVTTARRARSELGKGILIGCPRIVPEGLDSAWGDDHTQPIG